MAIHRNSVDAAMPKRIGVLSDTHGMLPGIIPEYFGSVDAIVHAGDVGDLAILEELRQLAPLTVVRGNCDRGSLWDGIPKTDALVMGNQYIYVLHDLNDLDLDPWAGGCVCVISGHTHVAKADWRNGVLFLNPGSASVRRRPSDQLTCALLTITGTDLSVQIKSLPEERR